MNARPYIKYKTTWDLNDRPLVRQEVHDRHLRCKALHELLNAKPRELRNVGSLDLVQGEILLVNEHIR